MWRTSNLYMGIVKETFPVLELMEDIHGNMCGIGLLASNADRVAQSTRAQSRLEIGSEDESVRRCISEILGFGRGLVNIVTAR